MFRPIIFAGTTEGRRLAEFCKDNCIAADVSVATEYGAKLLPDVGRVLIGRADSSDMSCILAEGHYSLAVDATHPYAREATENICTACKSMGVRYVRLLRQSSEIKGMTAESITEIVELLNSTKGNILSTLGSKSFAALSEINERFERVWLRVLPSDSIAEECHLLGFDTNKLICEKGPFSTEQNLEHIKLSGADWLITKESGPEGGYPQKIAAAELCGIKTVTLLRPKEKGLSFDEVAELILSEKEKTK
ncbi:MAG: precorrin-6A reductase [Ruminococcus sp.]|nr:precorrin-6A reductase [Ruminococcus sp.]